MKKLSGVLLVVLFGLLSACGPGTTTVTAVPSPAGLATTPNIKIVSPKDGDTMSNPLTLKVSVTGVTLIPAATPSQPGQGHLHIIVDDNPSAVGQAVPKDDTHIHFGTGVSDLKIDPPLKPGKHKLTILFADSNHIVTNPLLTDTINVTVQ